MDSESVTVETVSSQDSKQRGANHPFDASETKRTLLKLLANNEENLARAASAPNPHSARMWWPSVRKVFSLSRKNMALSNSRSNRPKQFEIEKQDLHLYERIGEGFRATVFAAELIPHERVVAVKRLRSVFNAEDEERRNGLVRDLETLAASLRHPSIVEFLGVNFGRDERAVNLIFEHMGGGTLESFYDSRCVDGEVFTVSFSLALTWSKQLFEGLKFLHERADPIIHRDLKPCNLMLSADFQMLKMRDFGVSKTADLGIEILSKATDQPAREILTDLSKLSGPSSQGYTGTARYMAPEIDPKMKRQVYTSKVDIYSAGLILWFILEGERPWEQHHGHVAFATARKGRRPPLCSDNNRYPLGMASLIQQCWAHEPHSRPSARMALKTLDVITEEASSKRRSCMTFRRN